MSIANARWHAKVFLTDLRFTTNIGQALYERRYPRNMRRRHVFYSHAAHRNERKLGRSFNLRKLGRSRPHPNAWSTGTAMRLRYLERQRRGQPAPRLQQGDYQLWSRLRLNKPAKPNALRAVRRANKPVRQSRKPTPEKACAWVARKKMLLRLKGPGIRAQIRRKLKPIFEQQLQILLARSQSQ